eukprot:TRINITY_DN9894_c0_g1_i1.p1 TRINITY_DN9894_c0_g1~~TRINITY_DN9894_c0_g1_i1.p1  ORF type:complete len:404 (-),score=44.50 TRINITY_DN9894_c0_g1_i1:69-1280(-)
MTGRPLALFTLIVAIFLLCISHKSDAAKHRLGVGIQLLNADTIDTAGAYWTCDVMIYIYNQTAGQFIDYTPRIQNQGRVVRTQSLTQHKALRYYGTLFFRPDASNFPFDSQLLEIAITDDTYNMTEVEFYIMDAYTSIDPSLRLRGWFWDPNPFTNSTYNVTYAATQQSFSVLSFYWKVSRSYVISVQMLIPPSLMLVSVFVSYSIPITQSVTRLGIVQSALVSETLLHTGLVRTTATGTIMLFDYFMILCYIVIILSIVENITVMVLMRGSKSRQALGQWIEHRAKVFVWLFCPGLFTIFFLQIYFALLIIILPSVLFFSGRFAYRNYIEWRNAHKTREDDDSDDESDEENQTRLTEQSPTEETSDFRKTVIENEIKKDGSKGHRKVELPADWRDTSDEESS